MQPSITSKHASSDRANPDDVVVTEDKVTLLKGGLLSGLLRQFVTVLHPIKVLVMQHVIHGRTHVAVGIGRKQVFTRGLYCAIDVILSDCPVSIHGCPVHDNHLVKHN